MVVAADEKSLLTVLDYIVTGGLSVDCLMSKRHYRISGTKFQRTVKVRGKNYMYDKNVDDTVDRRKHNGRRKIVQELPDEYLALGGPADGQTPSRLQETTGSSTLEMPSMVEPGSGEDEEELDQDLPNMSEHSSDTE